MSQFFINRQNAMLASVTLQVLVCTIGDKVCGIDMEKVRELRCYDAIAPDTRAANDPQEVINLRDIVHPLSEINVELILKKPERGQATIVVVLESHNPVMALIVDSVEGMVNLTAGQIQPPLVPQPEPLDCLFGLSAFKGRPMILVDVEQLVSPLSMN